MGLVKLSVEVGGLVKLSGLLSGIGQSFCGSGRDWLNISVLVAGIKLSVGVIG